MTDEMNAHMRGSVLASDPPEHGVLRGVLSEKLAPRALAKLSDEIGGRADAIVAEAVSKGTFDAVTDLCARLPVEAVADLIGLPRRAGTAAARLGCRLRHLRPARRADAGPDAHVPELFRVHDVVYRPVQAGPGQLGRRYLGTRSTTAASGRDPPSRC